MNNIGHVSMNISNKSWWMRVRQSTTELLNCIFRKSNNLRALIQFFNLFNNNNNNKYQRMLSIKKSPYLIAFIIQTDIIKRKNFRQKNDWFFECLFVVFLISKWICYPKEKSNRIDFEGTKDPTEFNWYNNNGIEQLQRLTVDIKEAKKIK